MFVFLDFEASSLSNHGYPIEVGWVFENGREESYLIRPAPGWDDWDERSEAIHGIDRATLEQEGVAPDLVARRMVETLRGHDIRAGAPSWDGKWLGHLLRAGGYARHTLRLNGTDEALVDVATAALAGTFELTDARVLGRTLASAARAGSQIAPRRHRALADASEERRQWIEVRLAAEALRAEVRNLPAA